MNRHQFRFRPVPVEPSIISDRICNADRLSFVRVIAELMVPTLVPKPGSPTVTQAKLTGHESTALRVLALLWLRSGREICSLKIRVSVVRLMERQLRCPDSLRKSVRPWPPFFSGVLRSHGLLLIPDGTDKLTSRLVQFSAYALPNDLSWTPDLIPRAGL